MADKADLSLQYIGAIERGKITRPLGLIAIPTKELIGIHSIQLSVVAAAIVLVITWWTILPEYLLKKVTEII